MICEICQGDFKSLSALHRHLNKHNIKQAEYYHSFKPRYDKFDNSIIIYKDYKSYHSNDFNSRNNFLKWAFENYKEKSVQDYCFNLLFERKKQKDLSFIPSQVELKGLMCPTWLGYEKMFGRSEFIEMCREIDLLNRFHNTEKILKSGEMEIWIDTREQYKLNFDNIKIIDKKLTVGDYAPSPDFYCDVFVERKSLADLAGTLSSGLDRFEREIARAADLGLYLVVVTESSFSDALNYSPLNSFAKKITGAHLMHEIRSIMQKFNNIQFLFAENRKTSAIYIETIFRMGDMVKYTDLELLKDRGVL